MVCAPRDEAELKVVWNLVLESYRYARGEKPLLRYAPLLTATQGDPAASRPPAPHTAEKGRP